MLIVRSQCNTNIQTHNTEIIITVMLQFEQSSLITLRTCPTSHSSQHNRISGIHTYTHIHTYIHTYTGHSMHNRGEAEQDKCIRCSHCSSSPLCALLSVNYYKVMPAMRQQWGWTMPQWIQQRGSRRGCSNLWAEELQTLLHLSGGSTQQMPQNVNFKQLLCNFLK